MTEYGCSAKRSVTPEIAFFFNGPIDLRGFAEVNRIYINADHITSKSVNANVESSWLNALTELDIITISIHEYGHVKLRK